MCGYWKPVARKNVVICTRVDFGGNSHDRRIASVAMPASPAVGSSEVGGCVLALEFHLSFRRRCDQGDLAFSGDLVFHTLELPKYEIRSDNLEGLPRLEKWLYFLRHAEHWEAEDLATRLVEAEFREAAGVLEMISQSPEELQFYEARLKFLHDALQSGDRRAWTTAVPFSARWWPQRCCPFSR